MKFHIENSQSNRNFKLHFQGTHVTLSLYWQQYIYMFLYGPTHSNQSSK